MGYLFCDVGFSEPSLHSPCRSYAAEDFRALGAPRRSDGLDADRPFGCFPAGDLQAFGCAQARTAGARKARGTRDALQRTAQSVGALDRLDEPLRRLLART